MPGEQRDTGSAEEYSRLEQDVRWPLTSLRIPALSIQEILNVFDDPFLDSTRQDDTLQFAWWPRSISRP